MGNVDNVDSSSPLQRSIRALRRRFQDGGGGQVSGPRAAARFPELPFHKGSRAAQFGDGHRGSGKTPLFRPFSNQLNPKT